MALHVLLLAVTSASGSSTNVSRPNHILFSLIDDYGFGGASYKNDMYNGTASPPTPNIDALAMSGVRLESYYVSPKLMINRCYPMYIHVTCCSCSWNQSPGKQIVLSDKDRAS
jgi:hypothetical protein